MYSGVQKFESQVFGPCIYKKVFVKYTTLYVEILRFYFEGLHCLHWLRKTVKHLAHKILFKKVNDPEKAWLIRKGFFLNPWLRYYICAVSAFKVFSFSIHFITYFLHIWIFSRQRFTEHI